MLARARIALVVSAFLSLAGCQTRLEMLQGVAKDWCETIRASQVIPVYPLTEDLRPGDVFLVQTPVAAQADLYRKRGFLALDDHRARLNLTKPAYQAMYFDGYFKDEFGAGIANPRPVREGGTGRTSLSNANLPRAAFPTYAFEVKSGLGATLAIPIKGVPVGLNFLATDSASGSVTIADARTYGAGSEPLLEALNKWAADPMIRKSLSDAKKMSGERRIYLRVVSRVYMTGGVVVSLTRSGEAGVEVTAGKAPPVGVLGADGTVNENYDKVLAELNKRPAAATDLDQAGGAVKFVGASSSSVTLAESFDTLLVIGYLGFDVPVFDGGVLGGPVPTFERLEGRIPESDAPLSELTIDQKRYKVDEAALESLGEKSRPKALKVMKATLDDLRSDEFTRKDAAGVSASDAVDKAKAALGGADEEAAFTEAMKRFKRASERFVSAGGRSGANFATYSDAFTGAFDKRDQE